MRKTVDIRSQQNVCEHSQRSLFLNVGTVFLEFWKRECASLAYEWDVNSFETTEPDRPGYETSTLIYVRNVD